MTPRLSLLAVVIFGIIDEEARENGGETPDLPDEELAARARVTERAVRNAKAEIEGLGAMTARKVGRHNRYTPHQERFDEMPVRPMRRCNRVTVPKTDAENKELTDRSGTYLPLRLECPLGLECPVTEVAPQGPDGVLTNILPVAAVVNTPPPEKTPGHAAPREPIQVKPPERAQEVARPNRNSSSGSKAPPPNLTAEEQKVADAIDNSPIREKIGAVPPTIVRELVREGITSQNVSFLVAVALRAREWSKLNSAGFLTHLVDQALRDARRVEELGKSGIAAKTDPADANFEQAQRILAERAEYQKLDPASIPWAEDVLRKKKA